MTQINLHGLLSLEFGSSMKFFLNRPRDVFSAIDANKKGFLKRIKDLSQIGMHYSIIIDGKDIKDIKELELKSNIETIDLIPVILGTGKVGGAIMTIVGIALLFVPGFQPVGVMLISQGVQMMLAPKPGILDPPKASVGTASALSQSFFFSNTVNLSQQGAAIPLGYGRMKIGSSVIQSSRSSYPIFIGSDAIKQQGVSTDTNISTNFKGQSTESRL